MSVAIKIEGLSKQYRLGQVGTGTISHDLNRWWAKIRGKEDPYSTVGQVNKRDQLANGEYVWAVKDIDLEIMDGEVVGIVGANGAGKSTLLKLISRITSPTLGTIKARGRIASLLEVGTGMHPEMTARENVYLNGAILGMRRYEITNRFDDIIEFAGCRMFVDTPVKRFSSGMKVRLGFAVAAFLDPEILIVDEVLAVGDAEFQKQCIGKMHEISAAGARTILFVSHNLASVEQLCPTSVWIANGSVKQSGPTSSTLESYISSTRAITSVALDDRADRTGIGGVRFTDVEFCGADGPIIETGKPVTVSVKISKNPKIIVPANLEIAVKVVDARSTPVFAISTRLGRGRGQFTPESGTVRFEIPALPVNGGEFDFHLWAGSGKEVQDSVSRAGSITIASSNFYGSGCETIPSKHGHVAVQHSWEWMPEA